MDRRDLIIEAEIAGEKGYYECPINLFLYGTNVPDARESLIAKMRADKLPIQMVTARQREEQKMQKLAAQAAKQARKKGEKVVDFAVDQFEDQFLCLGLCRCERAGGFQGD